MRIAVADDHVVVRRGLQQIIGGEAGWSGVAEIASPEDLLPALRAQTPDVLLLDVALGGRNGIELLPGIRAEFPSLPVLILGIHPEEEYAVRCLSAGASGYIAKDRSAEQIVEAIRRVAGGGAYVSDAITDQLAAAATHGRAVQPHERLSRRELEVFRMLGRGLSVSEIAQALDLSVKTVSTYRTRILEKTGFRTNAEVIAYAFRNGIV
jgi:two-component system invasion response regulator UvrY